MRAFWQTTNFLIKRLNGNDPSKQTKAFDTLVKKRRFEKIRPIIFELLASQNFEIRKKALNILLQQDGPEIKNLSKAVEILKTKLEEVDGKQKAVEDYIVQFIPLAWKLFVEDTKYSIKYEPQTKIFVERELSYSITHESDYSSYSSDTTWEQHTTFAVYEDGEMIAIESKGGPGIIFSLMESIKPPKRTVTEERLIPEKIELIPN